MSEPRPASEDPERLFVEFLRQVPEADLESWCRRHPVHAPRLRALHASYQTVVAQLRAAGISLSGLRASPTPKLSAASSSTSEGLLRRIVAQGPKGSRFRIQGEVARGGMGAILRVRDEDLGRDLAMKVVLGRDGASDGSSAIEERMLSRFLEEAQITGQLEHPGVVPVHEVGLDADGRVYFTMRLVKGRNLEEIFRLEQHGEEGWSRTRVLGVLLRVCEAVAFAHSRGVVHRDLKPTNVMVGSFGEVYVMDWGLAHAERSESTPSDASVVRTARAEEREQGQEPSMATLHGEVLGTPSYMPPEQARGAHQFVTQRADVYAVGAMLYHLLAHRPPYTGSGGTRPSQGILEALLAGPPTPLRELAPDATDELVAITEKAMARRIEERYAGMLELGDDLRAWLEGRVVRAHQTGTWIELRKWVARNRALSAAAAAALLFLITGLAASLWQRGVALENAAFAAERAEDARVQGALAEERAVAAAASARRAEAVRDFLTQLLANADPVQAQARDVLVADVFDDAVERLDQGEFAADPESEYALRLTLGEAYQGISRLEESERQFRRALELFAARATADPLERLAVEGDLGDTLSSRGRYEEVERMARARLAEFDALGVGDHAERALTLMQLASARHHASVPREAVEFAREAVAMHARLMGEAHLEVAELRGRLAFYLSQHGLYDEALAEAQRSIAALEQGTQRQRFEATEVMRTRSRIHAARRHNDAALEDLRSGLEIRRELFAGDGLDVANFEGDVGLLLIDMNRSEEAETVLEHCLEIRRRALGDHADTATTLTTLGSLRGLSGDFVGGRALLEEAQRMRVRVLGEDSAAIGDSQARLARLALREGDPQRAESLLRATVANWERALGPQHPDLSAAHLYLGQALRAQGRLDEARVSIERALSAHERDFGIDNPVTREARDEWYRLLLEAGAFAEVEVALRAARARPANQHPPTGAYLGALLGAALSGQGNYEEAEPLLLEGWRIVGPDERLWAVNKLAVLDALVAFYVAVEDPEQADVYRALAQGLR